MHLWNMLKHSNVLTCGNPEGLIIEHLIEKFGKEVFQGAPPKEKFIARFKLMMGQKVEVFAENKRHHRKGAERSRADRKGGDPALRHESGKGIQPVISEVCNLHGEKNGLKREQVARIKKKKAGSREVGIPTNGEWNDLLEPLMFTKTMVEEELNMLRLDFFKLQLVCVETLRQVWSTVMEDLAMAFGDPREIIEDETQLPFVVGWIMRLPEGPLLRKVLRDAGFVIQEFLGREKVKDYLLVI